MPNFEEPQAFIKAIHKAGVRYVLIGRQAIIAHGGPVQTMDYDIYIDGSQANSKLLFKIGEDFGLYPSLPKNNIADSFKFRLENDFIVDVLRFRKFYDKNKNLVTFDDIYKRRVVLKDKDLEINVASIKDLIILKELRSSAKDLEDIKFLKTLLENSAG